jgi:hypothetical protein
VSGYLALMHRQHPEVFLARLLGVLEAERAR